ncbi:class III poly(R)-hydroxyalkanoic acid synthase subunit PhaE [Lysobacter tyrosinilyticus]
MASGFNDFEQLARQYWGAWGEAMRSSTAPAQPSVPNWNDALGWWSQLAQGAAKSNPASGVDDAVNRFQSQAQQWFGQMQQLAAQFAGKPAQPADIVSAWQRMLGVNASNAFADMFKGMSGPGQHGVEQWLEQMAPMLQTMQRDGRSWLGLPAFGFAREHQERWQALAQAQLDLQEKTNAYNALMTEATQLAFRRFEDKLAERSEPGRQLGSARALFDLWIDAAEDAYAEIALSPRFRETYGDFINAQMKVRAGLQREVEQYCGQLGIPTRTEIDSAHRKIVQLERELRRLRDALQERAPAESPTIKPAAAKAPAKKVGEKTAAKKKGAGA